MTAATYADHRPSSVQWLGRLPAHWDVMRLKYLGDAIIGLTYGPDDVADEGAGTLVLRSSNVQQRVLAFNDNVYVSAAIPDRLRTRRGDILICSRNGSRALIGKNAFINSDAEGMTFGAFMSVFRSPFNDFLRHVFNSPVFDYQSGTFLTSTINQLTVGNLRSFEVPVPPLDEQTQIAKFLDYETAKIDQLIDKQQQLIALLKEKRQAVISHAVTKGLNPDVPMKDSGVEWLGQVPAHWEVSQLKHVVKAGTSITYGIVQAGPHVEHGVPYIKTSDMAGEALPTEGYSRTSPAIDESYARSRVFPGDIVMSIRASVGKCLPIPQTLKVANLTQGTAKISPGPQASRDFLLALLSSSPIQDYLSSMAKGATFKEITLDMLRRVPVLVPPLSEQVEIAGRVADLVGRFDRLSRAAVYQSELLKERRTALISAAVTGKIDVRNWQPPEGEGIQEVA